MRPTHTISGAVFYMQSTYLNASLKYKNVSKGIIIEPLGFIKYYYSYLAFYLNYSKNDAQVDDDTHLQKLKNTTRTTVLDWVQI